jgi:hypothetical protein
LSDRRSPGLDDLGDRCVQALRAGSLDVVDDRIVREIEKKRFIDRVYRWEF